MAPPSSGGMALIQILNILENVDFSKVNHNSKEYLEILISAMDFAYRDRAKYLGDPDFLMYLKNYLHQKNMPKKFTNK